MKGKELKEIRSLVREIKTLKEEEKKIRTLEYVTGLKNHLSIIGATKEMRKFNLAQVDILTWLQYNESSQLLLEYYYMANRVGVGIRCGLLDQQTILENWLPEWWVDIWQKLKPFIEKERKRRKITEIARDFEWLAKRCSQILKDKEKI